MALPKDNRTVLIVGGGLAVVAAVAAALVFSGGRDGPAEAPPAAKGGLTIDLAEAPTLEPARAGFRHQFEGAIGLVNPRYAAIDGIEASPSLAALLFVPELVVIAVPPADVAGCATYG